MHIFYAAYGGGHAPAVIPVIQEMQRRGHSHTFLALTTAAALAEKAGIDHIRIKDVVDPTDDRIKQWGGKLAEKHHTEGKGIPYEESLAYLGISFCNLADDLGEEQAWQRYEQHGLNAFTPVYCAQAMLRQYSPDAVIATTSPRMEKAVLRAAYRNGIPSLCMVELFGLLEEPWISRPDNGDLVAVSRPDVIRRLAAAGREKDKMFMTGSPMFDGIASADFKARGKAWRKERGLEDKTVIFWAEQPEPGDPELPRRVRSLLTDICKRHGWQLVVRLHPSSTDASGETIAPGVVQSHAHESLHDVMSACDVGITLTSTVGWEILLADKPLLVANISGYSNVVTYGQDDGALAVESFEEMEVGLVSLVQHDEKAAALETLRRALPKPGQATQKVCDLIEDKLLKMKAAA